MAHTTLESLFTDIADALRTKKGTSAPIVADDFPDEIDSIQTELPSQEKTVTAGTSATEVTPDEGYALSKVTVNPTPSETKTVTAGTSATTVTPAEGNYLSSVTVNPTPSQTKSATPSTSAQTIYPDDGNLLSSVSISAIQTETKSATPSTSAQTITPTSGKFLTSVSISAIQTETKSATPSESAQTITPTSGKYLTSVSVGAISKTYVGSSITRRDSSSLSASGATVSVPAGYYASAASKAVASGSAKTPATTKTQSTPSISVNSSGLITASVAATYVDVIPTVSAGYVSSGTSGRVTMSASSATKQLTTKGATSITPSTSPQTAVSAGTYCTGAITVNAVSCTGTADVTRVVNNSAYDLGASNLVRYLNIKSYDYVEFSGTSGSSTKTMKTSWNSTGGSFYYASWTAPSNFRVRLVYFTNTNGRSHGVMDFVNDRWIHNVDDVHMNYSGLVSAGWASSRDSTNACLTPGATIYIPANFSGSTFKYTYMGYYI